MSMDSEALQANAIRVSEHMKLLTNPSRLLILCHLLEGEQSVGELAQRTGMRPAAMSQQLAILRREQVVHTRREGHAIYYRLSREDIRELMQVLYQLYCEQ